MAKQTGLGDRLYVAGIDVSGDIGAIDNIGGGPEPLTVTDITQSGYERRCGLRDGRAEFTAWFDPATGASHDTFGALPTSDVAVTYLRGTTLGNPAASLVAKQINYDGSRGDDGSFTFAVQALLNAPSGAPGLEWGHNLTAGIASQGSAGSLAGFDDGAGAASDLGLTAYLHVFTFTGTSITVKLQDSDDDAAGDPYADITGAAFTAVSAAPAWQRLTTSSTENVKEWIRVTTTGTFSACTFAVVVVRGPETV